jgi:ribonuclease HII
MKLKLTDIRARYVDDERPLPKEIEAALTADPRAEAARLLVAIKKRRKENRAEGQRLRHMLRYEQAWNARGVTLVAGVDEAGMSPLAGPVVAGAVILPVGYKLHALDDSKKLDKETRDRLAPLIKRDAIAWAVGITEVEEIDRINIYHAGLLAMRRAIEALATAPQALLIDARKLKDVAIAQEAIIGGDAKSLSIAAASVIAKTTRDALMTEYDVKYPGYGFARHKGYGVPEHHAAMETLGCCVLHRRSFGPVRAVCIARGEPVPDLPWQLEPAAALE